MCRCVGSCLRLLPSEPSISARLIVLTCRCLLLFSFLVWSCFVACPPYLYRRLNSPFFFSLLDISFCVFSVWSCADTKFDVLAAHLALFSLVFVIFVSVVACSGGTSRCRTPSAALSVRLIVVASRSLLLSVCCLLFFCVWSRTSKWRYKPIPKLPPALVLLVCSRSSLFFFVFVFFVWSCLVACAPLPFRLLSLASRYSRFFSLLCMHGHGRV